MNRSAVLWIRVSSEPQSSGFSPRSQEDLLKKAAKDYEVIATYNVTESAKVSENRRKFKEMVEFVKANGIKYIFALSQDRLGRHYKDFYTIQSLIDDNGVSVVLVEPNRTISRESPIADRFLFQVMAAMAESDNRKRAADTKRNMTKAAEEGRVPHLVPIGYLNVADTTDAMGRRRTVIQDKDRAPLIAWAFEAFAEGRWSLATLAAELNGKGLTTKPSPRRSPRSITVGNLHKILKNRFYYGEFPSGGTLYSGNYKPLVTRDLWDKVQARLDANRTSSRPATKKFFAFRPFLKCGYCHCSMTADDPPGRHGKGKYAYYFCTSGKLRVDPAWYKKKFGTDKCPQKYWKEEDVGKLVEAEVGKLYLNDAIVAQAKDQLKTANVREEAFERKELRRLEAERTRKKNHLRISYQDRLDEKISLEQYEEVQAAVQADLHRIASDIARLSQHNFQYREQGSRVLELLKGVKDAYHNADLAGKHKFLEVMVDRIMLRDGQAFVHWQEPFQTLFDLGEMFTNKKMWGE